jgi:hypothetical protein
MQQRRTDMKEGWTLMEYIDYVNHFFLQHLLDFDYLDANKSTANALTVIGDDNA